MAKDAKKRALEMLGSGHDLLEQVGKVLSKAEVLVGSLGEGTVNAKGKRRIESDLPTFGHWVRAKMLEEGLTEKRLADEADIAFGTLHSYLNTAKTPTLANAARIVVALNADFEELFRIIDLVRELAKVKNLTAWMTKRIERP